MVITRSEEQQERMVTTRSEEHQERMVTTRSEEHQRVSFAGETYGREREEDSQAPPDLEPVEVQQISDMGQFGDEGYEPSADELIDVLKNLENLAAANPGLYRTIVEQIKALPSPPLRRLSCQSSTTSRRWSTNNRCSISRSSSRSCFNNNWSNNRWSSSSTSRRR